MKSKFEVSYDDLVDDRVRSVLTFRTTEDIKGSTGLVGQEKAEKAMEFGIAIKKKGYNIFISGKNGTGKTSYAKKLLEHISYNERVSDDWCYVYNFNSEYEPCALSFPPGIGRMFKQDIEKIIDEAVDKIPFEFNSEEYEHQKNKILEEYHRVKSAVADELNECAQKYGVQIKNTDSGYVFIPIVNDKPMSESEYDSLDKEERDKILKNISMVRAKTLDIIRKLKVSEKETENKISILDNEMGVLIIENLFSELMIKYSPNQKAVRYLESVKSDMLKNIHTLINGIDKDSMSREEEEFLMKYKVNLVVDNSTFKGSPVVYEPNPTYANLIGCIDYESRMGTITTDFLKIRAGSLLKANGGYLIISVDELLKSYQSWEGLKRAINSEEVRIEGIRSQLDLLTLTSLNPEPIPLKVKIILVGSEYTYQLLYEYDSEFQDLFKVKVDFDEDMERNDENIYKVAQFISNYCSLNKLRHVERDGVAAIIEYSSRLAGTRNRLTTCFEKLTGILEESDIWAGRAESRYIGRDQVKKAIRENNKRINLIEEQMLRMYRDKKIMIDVKGEVAGQINGLSVIEIGGYSFGKPTRITASTHMGKEGIVNIEREVQMSGSIHSKGVMIIEGYLGDRYAQNIPLSLSGRICFEQLYGHVEGDSASIAELYALLSSLSGVGLKQSIAVTGSLNQKGEVQPVGQINEKIEGFYRVCSLYGINKKQGVIIPCQNLSDVMLDDDIMRDIRNGMFHIYTIKRVEEGIEILTDMNAGNRGPDGEFEANSFNYLVDKKLKDYIRNYNLLDEKKQD